ncbi:hypothetical protein KDH_14640 [Dictyobacter sp. S3.2.2.5]|uniref:Uncharacterized protein n=1 Tax=Dictyobacter halimunensis TaxID=3026934 RepID=A0ABQ6FLS5_9CHLR|nr:hypothetical protein KDH_14640 [Dictyobacter sp. S3.2.2.5]
MGKDSWIYYAPYQDNIYQAFIDLKRAETIVDIESLSLFPQRYAGCTLDEHLVERFYEADKRYHISFGELPFDLAAELPQHDAIWGYVQMYIEMTIQWEQTDPQQPRSLPPQLYAISPITLSREEILAYFSQHVSAQRQLIFWISIFLYQAPFNDQTVIWPLSAEQILEFFGTSTPTKELARSLENRLWDLPLCWYTILYDGDRPSEILFVGASGD